MVEIENIRNAMITANDQRGGYEFEVCGITYRISQPKSGEMLSNDAPSRKWIVKNYGWLIVNTLPPGIERENNG